VSQDHIVDKAYKIVDTTHITTIDKVIVSLQNKQSIQISEFSSRLDLCKNVSDIYCFKFKDNINIQFVYDKALSKYYYKICFDIRDNIDIVLDNLKELLNNYKLLL
jgi:hypothetical protein